MSEQANIKVVQQAYDAFVRGDVDGVLATLTEDVDWNLPGPSEVSYSGRRRGKDGAAEFFRLLGESDEVLQFEPREFFTNGDKVVVLGHYRARARATGKIVESDWAHAFTTRNAKIASFQEYIDTAALAAGYRR